MYEAPHRFAATIGDLAAAIGDQRRVVLVRELTKLHEEVWRGSLGDAEPTCSEVKPRGEYVVVVAGAPEPRPRRRTTSTTALRVRLAAGVDRKTAVAEVARELGVAKRVVYDASLRLT